MATGAMGEAIKSNIYRKPSIDAAAKTSGLTGLNLKVRKEKSSVL
jgi:hypothetical protein